MNIDVSSRRFLAPGGKAYVWKEPLFSTNLKVRTTLLPQSHFLSSYSAGTLIPLPCVARRRGSTAYNGNYTQRTPPFRCTEDEHGLRARVGANLGRGFTIVRILRRAKTRVLELCGERHSHRWTGRRNPCEPWWERNLVYGIYTF